VIAISCVPAHKIKPAVSGCRPALTQRMAKILGVFKMPTPALAYITFRAKLKQGLSD